LPLTCTSSGSGKYNEFIPKNLLRKQFVEDYLDFDGLRDVLNVPIKGNHGESNEEQ